MNARPFFSVIIPTYNRALLLPKSIGSVLSQDFDDFELIVVDDGSTDNTENVVKSFSDSRIRYYLKQNQERNFARNFGLEKAAGRYICFLDSDDYYLSNHLSTARQVISHTKAMFIHLGYQVEDTVGNLIRKTDSLPLDISHVLINENVLSSNGIIVEKELINSVQFVKSVNYLVGENHLLWLQLHVRSRISIVNDITTVMVEHSNRSLRAINAERYLLGLNDMMIHVQTDELFFGFYRNQAHAFVAERFRFGALLFALRGKRIDSIKCLLKALSLSKRMLFKSSFYAVLKYLR